MKLNKSSLTLKFAEFDVFSARNLHISSQKLKIKSLELEKLSLNKSLPSVSRLFLKLASWQLQRTSARHNQAAEKLIMEAHKHLLDCTPFINGDHFNSNFVRVV